jgi:type II secretion system protein L
VLGEALATLEFEARTCEHGLLAIVARNFDMRDSVNLLHGPYSRREKIGQHLRPWLAPAALLAAWVLLVFGLNLYQYIALSQQSEQLHGEMVQIYKQAFPDAQKVPAPGYVRQQMEQRLEQLRRGSGESQTSFQAMFAVSAPVFAKMNGVKVTALRYYDGRMDVELDLKQADQLQALTDELSRKTGWQVQVQSAATRGETTQVRLQIEGVSG